MAFRLLLCALRENILLELAGRREDKRKCNLNPHEVSIVEVSFDPIIWKRIIRNETRCIPGGWNDEGGHGSLRNWPWREVGVCAHFDDSWAIFLTTCCRCTDSARYYDASTCCYFACGNNEWRWGTCSLGSCRTYCHKWRGATTALNRRCAKCGGP